MYQIPCEECHTGGKYFTGAYGYGGEPLFSDCSYCKGTGYLKLNQSEVVRLIEDQIEIIYKLLRLLKDS